MIGGLMHGHDGLPLASMTPLCAADHCSKKEKEMEQQYRQVDKFDRMMGALANLPDVTHTKPSTVVAVSPLIGEAQTFILQTFRQREIGDTIFLQYVDGEGRVRIAIPPDAADAIARQRDALTTKVRRKIAKDQAQARKARGEVPGFLRKKSK
jgi:hypothetical protein